MAAKKKAAADAVPATPVQLLVLSPVRIGDERFDPGEIIDIDPDVAAELELLGCLGPAPVAAAKPPAS